MKDIKIYFCDFWMGHSLENDFFLNLLKDKYNFIIDKKILILSFVLVMGMSIKNTIVQGFFTVAKILRLILMFMIML